MKAIFFLIVTLVFNVYLFSQTNTWEGDDSNDWLTAGNWSQGSVPAGWDDVIIPSGTTHSPMLDDGATCYSITIQTGADLEMDYGGNLNVYGDFESWGSVTFSGCNTVIHAYGDFYWKSGSSVISTFTLTPGNFTPDIYARGSWTFDPGSNVVLDSISVVFNGSSTEYIHCHSSTSKFYTIDLMKNGTLIFSNTSTEDLIARNSIIVGITYVFSTFTSNSTHDIICGDGGRGYFETDYGNIHFNNGTLIINPTDIHSRNIYFKPGDYCNDLIISSGYTGTARVNGSIEINGDLTVNGGPIAFNDTTFLAGHLTNSLDNENDLSFHIIEFDGNTVQTVLNGFDCDTLILNKTAGDLRLLNDTTNCNYYDWAGGAVNVMGVFTANDLIDNGIFGEYWLSAGGIINLTNNDGYVDLNGSFYISGGTMNIYGGTFDSYWGYANDCILDMDGGVLDFKDQGIVLDDNHNLDDDISGGTIRTSEGFNGTQRTDFNPTAGTFEFYGGSDYIINQGSGNSFHHVEIDKGSVVSMPMAIKPITKARHSSRHIDPPGGDNRSNTITLGSDLHLTGDMLINSGTLDVSANNWRIYLDGDWANNVGDAGFNERNGTVEFEGGLISQILTNETFWNLVEDKTSVSYRALELGSGDGNGVDMNVLGTLSISDGDMELNAPCTLSIGYRLDIEDGSTLNANDAGTMLIQMAGETWFDHNTGTDGFSPGTSSVVEFNGSDPGVNQCIVENAPFDEVVINSDAKSVIICTSGPTLGGTLDCNDMDIQKGEFELIGNKAIVSGTLTVFDTLTMTNPDDSLIVHDVIWKPGSVARITNGLIRVGDDWTWEDGTEAVLLTDNIVEFYVDGNSLINCQDADATFGTLLINKPSGTTADTYIHQSSTEPMRVAGNMTLKAGNQFHLQGKELQVSGSLNNEAGSEIDMATGAFLEINDFLCINGSLNIGEGSVLVHDRFDLETTGTMSIDGGSMVSDVDYGSPYWCNFKGTLNISDGLLESTNRNHEYHSTFTGNISGGTVKVGGAFRAYDLVFQPTGGTVEIINGKNLHLIDLNNGNWFHNLIFNNTGLRYLLDTLIVKNNLLINAGGLMANDELIFIGGNWTNIPGSAGFDECTSAVFFNGNDPGSHQYIYGETFYNLINENTVSRVYIAGNTTVTNILNTGAAACTTHVTAPTLTVQDSLIVTDATLILGATAPDVETSSLQMGGTIIVNDGSITADDLLDDYLQGNYNILGGTVDITQDTDPGSTVNLKGNITLDNGEMYIRGGSLSQSIWTGIPKPGLYMTGNSTLDFTDAGIFIQNDNIVADIQNGLIRCNGSININSTLFQPAGGTIEMYYNGISSVRHLAGSYFHNLDINPGNGMGYEVQMGTDIIVNGSLNIKSGTLKTLGKDLQVGN